MKKCWLKYKAETCQEKFLTPVFINYHYNKSKRTVLLSIKSSIFSSMGGPVLPLVLTAIIKGKLFIKCCFTGGENIDLPFQLKI